MSGRSLGRSAVVLAAVLSVAPADGMVPEDLFALRTVAVADLSPDGRHLLYTVGAWDAAAGSYQSTTYRRDLETGEDLLVFTPEDRSHNPAWRPDGLAVAYLRTTGEGDELWLMDADGGARRRVGSGTAFGSLHWSPDGRSLAWVARAGVGAYDGKPGVRIVAEDLGYRHLDCGYREGTLGQLFVLDLDLGVPRRLLDAPLDVRELAWSPSGERIAFAAKARADLGRNLDTNLWLIARGGGAPRRLTTNSGMDQQPRWISEDALAYLRAEDPLWESGPRTVSVLDPALGDGGPVRHHGYGDFFWVHAPDRDGALHILGARRGALDLVRLDAEGPVFLTQGGHDFWDLHIAGRRAVMSGSGQTLPRGIFVVDLDKPRAGARLIIDPNAEWSRRVDLVEPEPFTVKVDGVTLEGWHFRPADHGDDTRLPVVLSIHGGPEWMYGGYFLPEFHILPRFGYGVIIVNPVGSVGYGLELQEAIRGDWVERPAREVLAAVDMAVERGWADPERLAVMGGSYGAYLAAALTVRTDRFRAAAVDRMHPDPVSFWGTTDEKWFPEWEFMGRPWEPGAHEVYEHNSIFGRVERVRTPTLVSHGVRDYRCLVAGGEMWFSALQSLGVPSRLIRFETEGHGISSVDNQVFYLNELLAWFERWVLEHDEGETGP